MMSFKSDDLQPVTNLSNDLSTELNTSYKKVEKITELLKKIGFITGLDYENSSKQLVDVNDEQGRVVSGESNIQKVKNENLQLMMDIQREDYLGRKWKKVLEQNQNIFNSLTDWIKLNLDNKTMNSLEVKASRYLKAIRSSQMKVMDDEKKVKQRIDCMLKLLQELQSVIDEEIKTTTSDAKNI